MAVSNGTLRVDTIDRLATGTSAHATVGRICYRTGLWRKETDKKDYEVVSIAVVVCRLGGSWKKGIVRRFPGEGPSASSFFRARSV